MIFLFAILSGGSLAQTSEDRTQRVASWWPGDNGQRMRIRGRVTSVDSAPLPSNYAGVRRVPVTVCQEGCRYPATAIDIKDDLNLISTDDPLAVFLKESSSNGGDMMFGQFDIMLFPI